MFFVYFSVKLLRLSAVNSWSYWLPSHLLGKTLFVCVGHYITARLSTRTCQFYRNTHTRTHKLTTTSHKLQLQYFLSSDRLIYITASVHVFFHGQICVCTTLCVSVCVSLCCGLYLSCSLHPLSHCFVVQLYFATNHML